MSDFSVKSADLIVASGEHCADMLYATRLNLPDDFIYIGMDENKMAIVSDLEFDRAKLNAAPGVQVINQRDFGVNSKASELIKHIAQKFNIEAFRIPYAFPAGLAVQLHKLGVHCQVSEKSFFPQRNVKSDYEIDCIRQAMRVNEHSMQKAFDAIADCSIANDGTLMLNSEPFTSERLRSIIDSDLASNDAVGAGTIAAAGVHSSMPHHRGSGVIRAGESIVIDIFPRMNATGYFGDLTRTVVKGKAPEIVKKAFDAVKIVRDECKDMIQANLAGSVPYDHALKRLTELGFPTGSSENGFFGFFHGLGHGVGLEIHEAPRLSRKVTHLLQAGEVVTVEPGVYYPEWGGIRLEDIVVVRENACECLTQIDTFLEIE